VPVASIVFWGSALLTPAWSALGLLLARAARQVPILRGELDRGPAPAGGSTGRDASPEGGSPLPGLSIVVTARDEAQGIESTVRRLLAQRYPRLEIIVVDDRSTDATGPILDRLLAGSGATRLTVVHNRELPPGWLGKCHACRLGADRAGGSWILFLDGDVELCEDDLLERVLRLAEGRGLDHLAIIPDQRPVSALQQSLLAAFAQVFLLAGRVFEMDRDRPRGGVGIGAFNLIRRSAYDRIGGHVLLKMDPADDYKLGRLLKESGARQRLFDGVGMIRCPWHKGALNVARGLEKNLFAGLDYSIVELLVCSLLALFLAFGPLLLGMTAMLATRSATVISILAWVPFALQLAALGHDLRIMTRRQGGSVSGLLLLYPAAALLLVGAAWNSALKTLMRGGIRWRETFYPLAELRAGRVRAGAGRRLRVL